MTSNFHFRLLKDISLILMIMVMLLFRLKDDQNIKEFRARSNTLRVRSSYFRNLILADKNKNENNVIIFSQPNITSTVFEIILK